MEKENPPKLTKKTVGMPILISEKLDFKARNIIKDKEGSI